MLRKRFLLALLASGVAACSDTPTQSEAAYIPPAEPVLQTYQGVLVANSLLRTQHGLVSLAGWQTGVFVKLIGAEVVIEATAKTDPEEAAFINDFRVLTVDGFPTLDGTLGSREEGYFIRSREGVLSALDDVPEGLASFVGRRVFVAHLGGATMRYGLLELEE